MDINEIRDEYVERKERDYDESWAGTCKRSTAIFIDFLEEKDIDIENHKFNKIDVEDYKAHIEKRDNDYAGTTVKNMCMAIRDFIAYMNVIYDVDALTVKSDNSQDYSIYSAKISPDYPTRYEAETGDEIPYITSEEHKKLLEINENPRDDLLLRILWDTGCRPSEITSLTMDSMDSEHTDVFNGNIQVETAKRDNHTRQVYLGSITKRKLIKWLYKGGRKAYSSEARDSDYVFLTRRSPKMQPQLVNRQIKRLADRAGIQEVAYTRETDTYLRGEMQQLEREFVKINSKSYRHSFCVRSCKNGISLPELASLTGHSGTESLEPYTKFMPDDIRQAWQDYTRDNVGFK